MSSPHKTDSFALSMTSAESRVGSRFKAISQQSAKRTGRSLGSRLHRAFTANATSLLELHPVERVHLPKRSARWIGTGGSPRRFGLRLGVTIRGWAYTGI